MFEQFGGTTIFDIRLVSCDVCEANDATEDLPWGLSTDDPMIWGVGIIVGLALGILIFGCIWMYASGTDNFRWRPILYFGIYAWDFFSDVFFAMEILSKASENDGMKTLTLMILFGCSISFIVFPVVLNFRDLLKFQTEWQNDPLHSDRYRYTARSPSLSLLLLVSFLKLCAIVVWGRLFFSLFRGPT